MYLAFGGRELLRFGAVHRIRELYRITVVKGILFMCNPAESLRAQRALLSFSFSPTTHVTKKERLDAPRYSQMIKARERRLAA